MATYWVGCIARLHTCITCIVNVYVPPVTSSYAPSDYRATLTAIVGWVAAMRLQFGECMVTTVCGDFNARAGRLGFALA